MLDAFLEVLVEKEARHTAREELSNRFMSLPVDELQKIASGSMKLADFDDQDWLSKFKGTPLYESALQLEQRCLELDIQQQQAQQAQQAQSHQNQAVYDAKDGVRLQKRMLDLELVKMESSTAAGGSIAAGQPPAAGAPAPEAAPAEPQSVQGDAVEGSPKQASAEHDTLARVREHGSADEKARIFAAVTKKEAPKQKTGSISEELIISMRMQKEAMSPLHAVGYYGDQIDDAAGYGGVNGQVDPETLAMMREHAMASIGGHVSHTQRQAEHAAAHPIMSRVKGGLTGGFLGGATGLALGGSTGSGTGAVAGGIAGLLGGAALGQHMTRPEAYANTADAAAAAHGAITEPALSAALQRAVADQHLQRIQDHELETARSQGQYGQEARADAKRYSADLKHGGDSWGKYGEAVQVADAWGRQMAHMEKDAFPSLSGLGGALKGIGTRAVSYAKSNPRMLTGAAIGAGTGMLGGAMAGGPDAQGNTHRLSGALKGGLLGGAVGGAAGYAVPKMQSAMKPLAEGGKGLSFGQAAKGVGKDAKRGLQNLYSGEQVRLPGLQGKGAGIGMAPMTPIPTPGVAPTVNMTNQGQLFG
jgi:hypothetical protein